MRDRPGRRPATALRSRGAGRSASGAAALALVLLAAGPAAAPEPLDLGGLVEEGSRWIEENVDDEWMTAARSEIGRRFAGLVPQIRSALESADTEWLARLRPAVRGLLPLARQVPDLAPYADWLEARIDYFDEAEAAAAEVPDAPPPGVSREGPAAPPRPTSPEVRRRRTERARSPDVWKVRVSKRSPPASAAALMPRLKAAFRAEGVPEPWVWIAEVESSMNPAARSPAGAVGLFQFMPATARQYGLRTAPVDERCDPEKSAGAAARYLSVLHRRFDSWPLALAAYNTGEGRVSRILRERGATTFEEIAPHLAVETQMYVPRVLATVSRREGVDARALPAPSARRAL